MIPRPRSSLFRTVSRLLALGGATATLVASASASVREIKVDATTHPALGIHEFLSYEIPESSVPAPDRPWQGQAVRHVRTALSGLGLFEAPAGVRPDLTIEVDSGLTAYRSETRTRSVPVFPDPAERKLAGTQPITFVTEDYRVSVRVKYLMVTARPRGSTATLWRVQATLDDEATELEPSLPLLAAAVMNQVGHDSRGTRTMKLSPGDADVAFINQGLP